MNASDSDLLRQFARDGSEAAFAELVRRHVDLVYSAALRQVDPDVQAAEDVTQMVFTDLARKAGRLGHLASLAGWLYGSTRFEAMQHHRTKFRRVARETAAHAMSQLLATAAPEPDWDRLHPVLDEAMCDLAEDDREAVLMRYFEKRPLAEIGSRLGLSENTARMRVDRALDKLHAALGKRGITSTAAALGTLLGTNAVASAPDDLADRVSRSASGTWRRKRPVLARGGPGWLIPLSVALLLGISGLMWMNSHGWFGPNGHASQRNANNPASETDPGASSNHLAVSLDADHLITGSSSDFATNADSWTGPELHLKILTKDTGEPVPNVNVQSTCRFDGFPQQFTQYYTISSRSGEARVRIAPGTRRLEVRVGTEGFADTLLRWFPDKGQAVPDNYTLLLERGVLIGGRVVDPEGNGVAGADVRLHSGRIEHRSKGIESHEFAYTFTKTEEDGRWKIQRIAESMLHRCALQADAPGFQPSDYVMLADVPEQLKPLREEAHVLKLKPGISVNGIVVTKADEPVADAEVVLEDSNLKKSETRTAADGSFQFTNVNPYTIEIAAKAGSYPPKAVRIESGESTKGIRIVLEDGGTLRMRLVDQEGRQVAGAVAMPRRVSGASAHLPPFEKKVSDQDGRIAWTNTPPGTNFFDILAEGYFPEDDVRVPADGEEHPVSLTRTLVIQGAVTDAETEKPLPAFTLYFGQENLFGTGDDPRFFSFPSELTRINFTNGKYRHELTRKIRFHTRVGVPHTQFLVNFEADGYKTKLSRAIRYDEGVVILDAALERSPEIGVTVVDPQGREAAGAEAVLIKPGVRCVIKEGCFKEPLEALWRADNQGKLTLTKEPGVRRIVVIHHSGYLETSFEALDGDPVARLQPWSRVEGEVVARSSETGTVYVSLVPEDDSDEFTFDISATVDAAGRFALSKVPYGSLLARRSRPLASSGTREERVPWQVSKLTVKPGETARIVLGEGRHVTGQIRLPEDAPAEASRRGIALLVAASSEWAGPIETFHLRSPLTHPLLRRSEYVTARINEDGTFTIDSVNPGIYRLMAMFDTPSLANYTTYLQVRVPESPGAGEINIGEVMAEPFGP